MGWNAPDDWGSYYSKCSYCGSRVHASEGGCDCLEDAGQCEGCKGGRFFRGSDNLAADEGWHPLDELTEIGGKYFCEEHIECGCCESKPDDDDAVTLAWSGDADMLLCPKCVDEDHYCAKDGPLLDHMAKATAD